MADYPWQYTISQVAPGPGVLPLSGNFGSTPLAVRAAAPRDFSAGDLTLSPLQVDSVGNLRVIAATAPVTQTSVPDSNETLLLLLADIRRELMLQNNFIIPQFAASPQVDVDNERQNTDFNPPYLFVSDQF